MVVCRNISYYIGRGVISFVPENESSDISYQNYE